MPRSHLASAPATLPTLTIYGDLSCPYSALASYRATWLEATGRARVDFRLVHTDRAGASRQQLQHDVDDVRQLLLEGSVFPIRLPPRLPDTAKATARYAAAHAGGQRTRSLRVRLFRAVWIQGDDVADDRVLGRLGVPDSYDSRPADRWRGAWERLGESVVPLLVASDGSVHREHDSLRMLLDLRSGSSDVLR